MRDADKPPSYTPAMDALVLDFDGVIVDSEVLHDEALREVSRPLGASWEDHPWIGWSDDDALREILVRCGQPPKPDIIERLLREKTRVVLEQVAADRYAPYPGVIELIREAAGNTKVGVCSAGLREQIVPVLERLGVLQLLSAIVAWEDSPRGKPHPDPYLLAAERLHARPEHSIAIEDSPRGVHSALAAGFTVIAVGHTSPRQALSHAHHYAETIAQVATSSLREAVMKRA